MLSVQLSYEANFLEHTEAWDRTGTLPINSRACCQLQHFSSVNRYKQSSQRDLNPQPFAYKAIALIQLSYASKTRVRVVGFEPTISSVQG